MSRQFTSEQMLAMTQSKKVLEIFDEATRDHVVRYDPSRNSHPNLVSFNKLLADKQVAKRFLTLSLPDGALSVRLQRRFAASEPERFGRSSWHSTFQGSEFTPYQALDVAYTGLVRIGWRDLEKQDSYAAYRIHQPHGQWHGLGLIIASTLVHKTELTPVNREPGAADEVFKTATQHLFSLAAHSPDTAQAEAFEKAAESSAQQEYIVSDSFEPENGYRILDARGADQLLDTLRFAIAYGEDNER